MAAGVMADSSKTFTSMSGSFSLHSFAEGNEIISEVDEIHEMRNLQRIGDEAFDNKNFSRAIRYYTDALDLDEQNSEILGSRAAAYMEVGDGLLALKDAKRLSALKPSNPQAHFMQGIALECLQQYHDATVQFIKAMENTNNLNFIEKIVFNVVSTVSKFCKLPEKMIHAIKDMDPYVIISEVGVCLFHERRYDMCIHVLNASHKLQTKQAGIKMKIQLTMANAHSALKHPELAISLYQECLQTALSSHDQQYQAKALVNIASLYLEAGEIHQAIMYYEKILALKAHIHAELSDGGVAGGAGVGLPDYWTLDLQCALHLNLSIAYKGIGNLHLAMHHAHIYQQLVSAPPVPKRKHVKAQSYKNVAMLQEILYDYQEALRNYELYLKYSKEEGDARGVVQAYGCLGAIYATMCNKQLALTYLQQQIKNARRLGDVKLVMAAYEQQGDALMSLEDYESSTVSYDNMLRASVHGDLEMQATALCKLAMSYKAAGHNDAAIFYFEQALAMSEDFGFQTVKTLSEYHVACIMQYSSVIHELDTAHKYFERLIHVFEAKIQQHRDEETFCPADLQTQLQQCYLGIQAVMIKLDEKEDCLVYSESYKKKYTSQVMMDAGLVSSGITGILINSMASYDMWTFDRIKRVVTQQNALIVCYSLLEQYIITWVLRPGDGLVLYYVKKLSTTATKQQHNAKNLPKTMNQHVCQLLDDFKSSADISDVRYHCENRALPKADDHLQAIKNKYKALSELSVNRDSSVSSDKSVVSKDSVKSDSKTNDSCPYQQTGVKKQKPAERLLYDLLIGALDKVLSEQGESSRVVIIPDQQLFHVPFFALVNHEGKYLGERYRVSVVNSFYALDCCHQNELNYLKAQDELQFSRQQAKHGGAAKVLNPYNNKLHASVSKGKVRGNNFLNLVDPDKVNPRKTSHPLLLTSGTFQRSSQQLQAQKQKDFTLSRESTFLSMSDGGGMQKITGEGARGTKEADGGTSAKSTASGLRNQIPGLPTAVDKMASLHTLTTLTSHTYTHTDITTSPHVIPGYAQISAQQRCLVIGAPQLPNVCKLHGHDWKSPSIMKAANIECLKVSDIFDLRPVIGAEATKERFLEKAPKATVIHIATLACHHDGYLVFTSKPKPIDDPNTNSDDLARISTFIPDQADYIVTKEEIASMKLTCQLVVLSAGWGAASTQATDVGHQLCAAFIAAGAECVVTLLWSIPNEALNKFYHHFYMYFRLSANVTAAVQHAVNVLKDDDRYNSPYYWSAFLVVGNDPVVSLAEIHHSMLDQSIDTTQHQYSKTTGVDPLNPPAILPKVDSKEEIISKLQVIFIGILSTHKRNPRVVSHLIELFDGSLKKLQLSEPHIRSSNLPRLPATVANHDMAMHLLKLTGFHFQPDSKVASVASGPSEPYVIFPFADTDELLLPCYDALRAISNMCDCTTHCIQTLAEVVPIQQDTLSHVIDILCITKHAPEVQLKVTDVSIRPLWKNKLIKSLLVHLGFHQVGLLLCFKNIPSNTKVLTGMLQLMLAVSLHKSTLLLRKLDVSLLGTHALDSKSTLSSEAPRLPTLTPLILPRHQLRMSTPWLTTVEHSEEMQEKLKLIDSKSHLIDDFRRNFRRAKTWHQSTVSAQAVEQLHHSARPKSTPHKVKVRGGFSTSQQRIPIDEKLTPTLTAIDMNRDYAHFVLNQRLDMLTSKHKNDIKQLYLPYVQN